MTARFNIQATANGNHSQVCVDGKDVSRNVNAYALFSKVGEDTVLQLHTHVEGIVEGEGIVEIYVDNPAGLGEWLRQVNRPEVDRRALERGGWGDSSTLTDHVIDVLLEMLSETQPPSHS